MTDVELIDAIERLRARNNVHWMNLVRLAFELAPDRARHILQEIERLDGEVRRLTQELAQAERDVSRRLTLKEAILFSAVLVALVCALVIIALIYG